MMRYDRSPAHTSIDYSSNGRCAPAGSLGQRWEISVAAMRSGSVGGTNNGGQAERSCIEAEVNGR
jgi:hypothetical protein